MLRREIRVCAGVLLGVAMAGCARPHETQDERIRRQAAEDARQIRHDAQNAGAEARKAAQQAGRTARDIVAGVREGWQEGAPPKGSGGHGATAGGSRLDLNTASVAQLEALPGVSAPEARRIVRQRPYKVTTDLVARGLLDQAEYDRIADRIAVHSDSVSPSD